MDGKFIIENLLQQEESERLEFKGEATVSTLAKTVTAMLNGNGGDIVLGVNNKNRIVVGCSKDIKDLKGYSRKNTSGGSNRCSFC